MLSDVVGGLARHGAQFKTVSVGEVHVGFLVEPGF